MKKFTLIITVFFTSFAFGQTITWDTGGLGTTVTSAMLGESFNFDVAWDTNGEALVQNAVSVQIVEVNSDFSSQINRGTFPVEPAGGATSGSRTITVTIPTTIALTANLPAGNSYRMFGFYQTASGFTNATGINGSPGHTFEFSVIDNPALSVSDFDLNPEVVLSPNPANSNQPVTINTEVSRIEVTNSLGQLVIETKNKNTFNVDSLNSGLYIVKIIAKNGTEGVRKLIIR